MQMFSPVMTATLSSISNRAVCSLVFDFANHLGHGSHGAEAAPCAGLEENIYPEADDGGGEHQAVEAEAELGNPISNRAGGISPAPRHTEGPQQLDGFFQALCAPCNQIGLENHIAEKLALLRILQILHRYSDCDHPLTQEKIAEYLDSRYGINIERKAVSRNIALLKDADFEIAHCRDGYYLASREFEDTELKLLVDSILCNQNITAKHSSELIEKLCKLSNKYFRSHVKNVHAVKDWNKSDNGALFYNIEVIDMAINEGKQVQYDYNKYGIDKKLHKSSFQRATPYQLILHNQRYYLMGYSEHWGNMIFHRLDRISNIKIYDVPAYPLRKVPGYEAGIDYKKISTTMPYLHSAKPERVELLADAWVIDQVVDWFGKDLAVRKTDDPEKIIISLWANPYAMSIWALQYINYVEVIYPEHLRTQIRGFLQAGLDRYSKEP